MPSAKFTSVSAAILLIITPMLAHQAQPAAADQTASSVTEVATTGPGRAIGLLPDTMAGFKATGDPKSVGRDKLAELVSDKAAVYQEYLVMSAGSREYAGARVDIFETRNEFAAFGLFQFLSGVSKNVRRVENLGSEGAQVDGEVLCWKGNFFVRVLNPKITHRGTSPTHETLARAVANDIVSATPAEARPALFDSLPSNVSGAEQVANSKRYFLGAESLNAFINRGREMFAFAGDTEAALALYAKVESGSAVSPSQPSELNRAKGKPQTVPTPSAPPVKLVIVECHTPEFATDEIARISSHVSSLSESEQQQIVFKRTGNYIVAAVDVADREFAESLVNSVQYPYTVKWLRNPLWPTNDPFRTQKAAQMLLSTFGLLGLILLTVLLVGTIFGTSVFLKRRKRQQEIFTDAGGMLRLDIDPFLLALPPKREE